MIAQDLRAQRHGVLGSDGGIRPDLKGQLVEIGLVADSSRLHRVIHLGNRRIDGVNGNHADDGLGRLVPVRGNIAATLCQSDLHIKRGVLAQSADVQLRVQNLNLGIGLDIAGSDLTGANCVDMHGFDACAVQLRGYPLDVQDNLRHILGDTGDGGELVLHALNLHRSCSIARQTAQQNAAQGVAQSHAVTALQRLHYILAVRGVLRGIKTGDTGLFNFYHESKPSLMVWGECLPT